MDGVLLVHRLVLAEEPQNTHEVDDLRQQHVARSQRSSLSLGALEWPAGTRTVTSAEGRRSLRTLDIKHIYHAEQPLQC